MSENRLAIGVDFGATTVKAGVVYQSHVIDQSPIVATAEFGTPDELIDAMVHTVENLRKTHPGVSALGVGVPGFVDFDRGLVHDLPNVPDWNSIRLGKILQDRTGLPTTVDNLGNCMAIAEWKCGAARGLRDVLFVKLETGLGGAIIANGQLVRGASNVGGEIGQASLDWKGRRGKFGNRVLTSNIQELHDFFRLLNGSMQSQMTKALRLIKSKKPSSTLCPPKPKPPHQSSQIHSQMLPESPTNDL